MPDDSVADGAAGWATLAGGDGSAVSPPDASTRALPAPPKPVNPTTAALCIGG
jgi:hypothetical protein